MIRLHEFITKIRNCKTQAEERAEYQKEMAAIRESFAVVQLPLRKTRRPCVPEMSPSCSSSTCRGRKPTSGRWSALNSSLLTRSSRNASVTWVPSHRHTGLTQLFHEKSELLMMATNRIRIDLNSNNNNIVGLVLCVLSEICTAELAKDLHLDVLKVTIKPFSAAATAQLIFAKKPFSAPSRSSRECLSILVSILPRFPPALKKRAMVCFWDAWPSWKMLYRSMNPILIS
jgi:hypothetical protein